MEEELGKTDEMLAGRQIAWMVYNNYALNKTELTTLDFQYLVACVYKTSLSGFMHAWDKCLLGMNTHPPDDINENLFRTQISKDFSIKDQMLDYERKHFQEAKPREYKYLRDMVCAHLEMIRQQGVVNNYRGGPLAVYPAQNDVCWSWSGKGNYKRGKECPLAASHTAENKGSGKGKGKG